MAHEQALADPNAVPLNFKVEPPNRIENTAVLYPPMNLPTLQNQPLHNLTIKDPHLLRPPLVMGASTYRVLMYLVLLIEFDQLYYTTKMLFHPFVAVQFNRRASDGGANLPFPYTAYRQQPQAPTKPLEIKAHVPDKIQTPQSLHPEIVLYDPMYASNSYFLISQMKPCANQQQLSTLTSSLLNTDDNSGDVER